MLQKEERRKMYSASVIQKLESDRLHPAFTVAVEGRKELIVEYESRLWGHSQSAASMLEKIAYDAAVYSQQNTAHFLLADGIVWEQCSEPAYRVYSDGSVRISVDDSESDTSAFKCFNAFQYEEALLTAGRIACGNEGRKEISFCPIRVHLPGMVKYPLNPEYASLYDAAGLRIPAAEGSSVEQIAYLAHFLKTDRFEVERIKGKGADALFLIGDEFRNKQKDPAYGGYFRRQVADILNDTALKPVPAECQLGDTAIWFGTWQVSAPE